MYLVVALVLIPLGVVILLQSSRLMQTNQYGYDKACNVGAEGAPNKTVDCIYPIKVPRATSGNVFLYYGMNNFFQNELRFSRSRSVDQLRGISNPDTGECKPCDLKSCKFDEFNISAPLGGDKYEKLTPCGLPALSNFNDTFKLCYDISCERAINSSSSGIAWAADRETLFRPNDANSVEANQLITSESFMVWMRLAPYNNWIKLNQRILEPLENRTYYLRIGSSYPVESFNGEKFVYLTETTWFGGPNPQLAIACIIVGSLALALAALYGVRSFYAPELEIPPETDVPWNDTAKDGSAEVNAALIRMQS